MSHEIGWTALQFLQWAEKHHIEGPYIHELRGQYLRTGTCDWDKVAEYSNELEPYWDRFFT